jgi:monofunctional biosynthetic peptidoglycan transglycosylase
MARKGAGGEGPLARAQRQRHTTHMTRFIRKWLLRLVAAAVVVPVGWVALYIVVNPPMTPYMWSERGRLGEIRYEWHDLDRIAPVMARATVAAEDANFCRHWGFDMDAIRNALEEGANRGASTISQQVVKNVFLWHGRSWGRKALEAVMTPLTEMMWSKRRILEVYLNVAEFDEGVFGAGAAARWYFGIEAADLSAAQAAQLAAVLPAPKSRSAREASRRSRSIEDGAATIRADGRAACFES